MPAVAIDRPSRLGLADAAADGLLASALQSVGQAAGAAVRSIPVARREDQPPLILHLTPIRGAAHDIFSRAASILVVTPVVVKEVPSADIVQGLFDLTPAEARLAALIAAGHRPRGGGRARRDGGDRALDPEARHGQDRAASPGRAGRPAARHRHGGGRGRLIRPRRPAARLRPVRDFRG